MPVAVKYEFTSSAAFANVSPPGLDPLAAACCACACVYWVGHLYDWQSSDNKVSKTQMIFFLKSGIIDNLLRQHYLHGLKALSLRKSMSTLQDCKIVD